MSKKAWLVFGIISAAIFGGIIWSSMQHRLDVSDINHQQAMNVLPAEERNGNIADHVRGNPKASVVVIEYGDFQCGPCKSVHPEFWTLSDKYRDHLAFIYRNFPIATAHPHARAAAAAAEAAGLQGKYWEMHHLLYERQEEWSAAQAQDRSNLFAGYAKQLGLNESQFTADVAKPEITKKINFDGALARAGSVSATPTVFVNGEMVKLTDTSSITNAVEAALKQKGVAVTPPAATTSDKSATE